MAEFSHQRGTLFVYNYFSVDEGQTEDIIANHNIRKSAHSRSYAVRSRRNNNEQCTIIASSTRKVAAIYRASDKRAELAIQSCFHLISVTMVRRLFWTLILENVDS